MLMVSCCAVLGPSPPLTWDLAGAQPSAHSCPVPGRKGIASISWGSIAVRRSGMSTDAMRLSCVQPQKSLPTTGMPSCRRAAATAAQWAPWPPQVVAAVMAPGPSFSLAAPLRRRLGAPQPQVPVVSIALCSNPGGCVVLHLHVIGRHWAKCGESSASIQLISHTLLVPSVQ